MLFVKEVEFVEMWEERHHASHLVTETQLSKLVLTLHKKSVILCDDCRVEWTSA